MLALRTTTFATATSGTHLAIPQHSINHISDHVWILFDKKQTQNNYIGRASCLQKQLPAMSPASTCHQGTTPPTAMPSHLLVCLTQSCSQSISPGTRLGQPNGENEGPGHMVWRGIVDGSNGLGSLNRCILRSHKQGEATRECV
jgi:hypothetical protein